MRTHAKRPQGAGVLGSQKGSGHRVKGQILQGSRRGRRGGPERRGRGVWQSSGSAGHRHRAILRPRVGGLRSCVAVGGCLWPKGTGDKSRRGEVGHGRGPVSLESGERDGRRGQASPW